MAGFGDAIWTFGNLFTTGIVLADILAQLNG
jgi:hypothetical protein